MPPARGNWDGVERRRGPIGRGGCPLDQHSGIEARIEQLERESPVIFHKLDRAPRWLTMVLAAATAALGTFFGLWIQSTHDVDKVVAIQYEIKGSVDKLTEIVAQQMAGHASRGAFRPDDANP
jgi:hypothetical protein